MWELEVMRKIHVDENCRRHTFYIIVKQTPMKKTEQLIGQHGITFDNMVGILRLLSVIYCVVKNPCTTSLPL